MFPDMFFLMFTLLSTDVWRTKHNKHNKDNNKHDNIELIIILMNMRRGDLDSSSYVFLIISAVS